MKQSRCASEKILTESDEQHQGHSQELVALLYYLLVGQSPLPPGILRAGLESEVNLCPWGSFQQGYSYTRRRLPIQSEFVEEGFPHPDSPSGVSKMEHSD